MYETRLAYELSQAGHKVEQQRAVPIVYKGLKLEGNYRIDLVVDGLAVVEIKTVERLEAVREAQLLTCLKLTGLRIGLLINFNVALLLQGICRLATSTLFHQSLLPPSHLSCLRPSGALWLSPSPPPPPQH